MDIRVVLGLCLSVLISSAGCTGVASPRPPDMVDYRITADEAKVSGKNITTAQVGSVPEQVRRAIEEASRPNDTDGGDVSVTRTQYEKSLRHFYSGSLSDLPRHRTYYVRRENVVYRIGFEVLGEG